jgi:hypothetical protein
MLKQPSATVGSSALAVHSNLSGQSSTGLRQYGLQLPKSKQQQAPASVASVAKAKAFAMEEDDDADAGGAMQTPVQLASIRAKKYAREQAKILESNPDAFSYDDLFEDVASMKKREVLAPVARLGLAGSASAAAQAGRAPQAAAPAPAPAAAPSRYISALLTKSAARKLDAEAVYERNLLKERAADDAVHAGKEKFLTSAFRAQLAEQEANRARIEEQDRRDEAAERLRAKGGSGSAALALSAARNLLETRAAGPAAAAAAAVAPSRADPPPIVPAATIPPAPPAAPAPSSKHARSDSADATSPASDERSAKRSKGEEGRPQPPPEESKITAPAPADSISNVNEPSTSTTPSTAAPSVIPAASVQTAALAAVTARLTTARNPLSKAEEAKARLLARKQQQQQP